MKSMILFLALCGVALAVRGEEPFVRSSGRQPLRVQQRVTPVFPRSLMDVGITRGDAAIVVRVDQAGVLSEWLIVGYSQREFADAALRAVRQWSFEPLLVDGRAVPSQMQLNFTFEASGVVVSLDAISGITAYMGKLLSPRAYRWSVLEELDRIPAPVTIIAPAYPRDLVARGVAGTALVEFFIDETGSVRMPAVVSADFEELGALAVEAVSHWKFEPPTRGGEVTLARVRQRFNFAARES